MSTNRVVRLRDWRELREWEAFKASPTVALCRGPWVPDEDWDEDDLDLPECNDFVGLPPPMTEPVALVGGARQDPPRIRGRRRR